MRGREREGREGGRKGEAGRGREEEREVGREGGLRERVLFSLYLNGCSIIGKVNYILPRNMQH